MARQTTTVSIGAYSYEMRQIGAIEGRRLSVLFMRLLSKVAPLLADAKKLDAEALGALSEILEGIEPEQLEPFWKAFSEHALAKTATSTAVLSDPNVFDAHFAGEPMDMWLFFVESAKFNFGGFLGRLLSQSREEKPGAATAQ
jgi:hypothetical protein